MGIKVKKLKKAVKNNFKYVDPITYEIISYPQERTKYEADAASNLLTGAGDSRRDYIKEVLMDGINERVTLLGSYITDRLLYDGPHVDQLSYFNQNIHNSRYTDLVGKVEASIDERTPITPGFTPLDLVKSLTGNPKIERVLLEEYGFLDFDWKVREIMTVNHPKYFSSGNWEVEVIDDVTHKLDLDGNIIEEEINIPEGEVWLSILLYDNEEFSSWTEEEQDEYKETHGPDHEIPYIVSNDTPPDRYLALYSEPMDPEITTEVEHTNGVPFTTDHLSPPVGYTLYEDNTVENTVELYRTTKTYREELDVNSNPYWVLIDESTVIHETLNPVYSGEIDYRMSVGADIFNQLYYSQINKFDWNIGVVHTVEEYTEIEYIQPDPDPNADPNDPLPDPVPVTVKYKKEVATDTLEAYTDITNTLETHALEYLHKYSVLNVPAADAEAYYHVAPVPVQMYPIIPLRGEYKWIDADDTPEGEEINTYVNRYIRLLLGIKKDMLLESLKESFQGDANKVASAVINFSVPINTTDPKAKWYLFDFFKRYASGSEEYKDARDIYHAELEAAETIINRLEVTLEPDSMNLILRDPVTEVTYPSLSSFPLPVAPANPPATVLPIVNSNGKYKLDRTLTWVSHYRKVDGKYLDLGINDVITEKVSGTLDQSPILVPNSDSTGVVLTYPDTNDKILRIVRQRETYYEIIELPTLRVRSREARGITITQDINQAFTESEGNVILTIPLVRDIFMRMPAPMRAQTALSGIMMSYGIFYTYKVKTTLGTVLDSISKIHRTAVNTYRMKGGFSDLLRSFERMHRVPTKEILNIIGVTMNRSDRDFENGFMKVFGTSRSTAKKWHGVIKLVIMIIISIFTFGVGGAVAGGASAGAAIGAAFGSLTAQQIAIMIATAVITMVAEITQQLYAYKMAELEAESSQMAAEYEKNLERLDAIQGQLGLVLEGYDITKMFNYNINTALPTEPMLSMETTEEFLANMNADPKSLGAIQDLATFEYITISRYIFSNKEMNLADYFNHSPAV